MASAYNLIKKRALRSVAPVVFMALAAFKVSAQTMSYEQTDLVKVPGVTNAAGVNALPQTSKLSTRIYVDGLGRPIQTVGIQASPRQMDMVQPVIYNDLGQTPKSYLPYTATTNTGAYQSTPLPAQKYFYDHAAKVANDDSLYSRQVFETSPLQRLLRAGNVGKDFEPSPGQHYKSLNYRTNTVADSVIKWSAMGVNIGHYAPGTLQLTDATDEDGTQTLAFTDNDGQPVLKRQLKSVGNYLNTYYVYNTAGGIRNVIPPKAYVLMKASGNWSLAQTAISNLIFSYEYDSRARQIQKTIPGGVSMYVVYDPIDRPVLMQDAKLRANKQWNYIKYDAKGHAISQGIYTDTIHTTLAAMQSYVNGLNYSTTYFESRNSTSATGYYTNNVFPNTNIAALGYSYYDDYDLDGNGTAEFSYIPQITGEATPTAQLRGIPTMVRSRTVGQGLGNIWLIKVMFYDKNYRTIQIQGNNQLNTAVNDIQTSLMNFTGLTTKTKVKQVAAATTTTIETTFSYDHQYRPTAIDQSYNSGTTMRIAAYEYNELGQLVKKNLKRVNASPIPYDTTLNAVAPNPYHQRAQNRIRLTNGFKTQTSAVFSARIATEYLQAVDYRYNIRGQMVNINNSKLLNDNGITNNDVNDLFGMDILYNVVDPDLYNTASYSGQISAAKWMTRDAAGQRTNERAYRYHYDVLGRIYQSIYTERAAASTGAYNINYNGFNEAGISYDDNGNILTMQRNSSTVNAASHIQVDDLTYTYDAAQPNRLKKVTDGIGANYTGYGFRNLTGSTADYSYDDAGNLTADPYKGLTLSYNELNRTDQVAITTATGRYLRYTYNSAGAVIRKQAYDNAILQKTTDYIDGFVYENNTLAYFTIPEGRVINNGGTLTPEFVITDQQGNARVSFRDNGSGRAVITQENSYYAFGLTFASSVVGPPAVPNKNLYNGESEWQNDFTNLPDLYQTFFRNYDQALGRFISLDPDAESAESLTGYQYAGNNPVLFNDPMGDEAQQADWLEKLNKTINELLASEHGGSSGRDGSTHKFSALEAFIAAKEYADQYNVWGQHGFTSSAAEALDIYNNAQTDPNNRINGILLREVGIHRNRHKVTTAGLVDKFQTGLDIVGMTDIPGVSQAAELLSAGISFYKGDYTDGFLSIAAMLPLAGKLAEGAKITRRIQKHHIIPNQIYKAFKKDLKAIGWVQHNGMNLKKLPTPFHGSHKAYNDYVRAEFRHLQDVGKLDLQSVKELQYRLRQEINTIYLNGYSSLNNFYKLK